MGRAAASFFEGLTTLSVFAAVPTALTVFAVAGWELAVATLLASWFLVTPVLAAVTGWVSDSGIQEYWNEFTADDASESESDPGDAASIIELRERYAAGEIGHPEFERRVEDRLETGPSESTEDERAVTFER